MPEGGVRPVRDRGPHQGRRYGTEHRALAAGRAEAVGAVSTDPQLLDGRYTVLDDPAKVFGPQHVAPVVKQSTAEVARMFLERNGLT